MLFYMLYICYIYIYIYIYIILYIVKPLICDHLPYATTGYIRQPSIYGHLSYATTSHIRPPVVCDHLLLTTVFLCVFDSVLIGYEASVDDHLSYATIFYGSSGGRIREVPLYIISNPLFVSPIFLRVDSHIRGHQKRFQEMG